MGKYLEKIFCPRGEAESSFPCSFTIEAACSLTIFIFSAVVLMVPLLMVNQHQNASTVMEENARKLAKYKYVEYYGRESGFLKTDSAVLSALETGIGTAMLASQVSQGGMSHVDLLTGTVIDDTQIKYVLNYDAQIPFGFLGLSGLHQQVVACRRAWVGAEDYRWGTPEGEGEEGDVAVYIGMTGGTVYHTTLYCTYFAHAYHSCLASEIDGTPSAFGSKFAPCQSCKPGTGNVPVYYTDGGKRYHKDPTCKAMRNYAREITLSQALAQGRHACVRCG